MATKHHTDFERLLHILFRKQQQAWESVSPDTTVNQTRMFLERLGQWRFMDEKTFKTQPLKDDVRLTNWGDKKLVVLLPPLKKNAEFVPLMSLEYAPNPIFYEACLRIRVLLIRQKMEGEGFAGLGFRIESPERHCQEGGEEGVHDFYHAQLVTGIGYGPPFETPEWLPCTQPSFPLWAVNPIDAILNLILTLYGRKFYKEFLVSISPKLAMSKEFELLNERLQR